MTIERYPHLLSPIQIGGLTVRNRVLSSGHGTNFATDGLPNARHLGYHVERAKGGIGLIIMEATSVTEASTSATGSGNIRNIDDRIIPPYRELADAVHAHGAKIMTMLSHSGRNTTMTGEGLPPEAPSP